MRGRERERGDRERESLVCVETKIFLMNVLMITNLME